jgi:hypothetical protein
MNDPAFFAMDKHQTTGEVSDAICRFGLESRLPAG